MKSLSNNGKGVGDMRIKPWSEMHWKERDTLVGKVFFDLTDTDVKFFETQEVLEKVTGATDLNRMRSLRAEAIPFFSSDMNAAWKLTDFFKEIHLSKYQTKGAVLWECVVYDQDRNSFQASDEFAPAALCKAALLSRKMLT